MLCNFTTSFFKRKMFPYLSVFTVCLFITVLNFLLFNAAQAMVWSLLDKTACTGHSSFSSRNFNRHFIFFSLTISFVCLSVSLSPICIFIILASNLNPHSNLVKPDVIQILSPNSRPGSIWIWPKNLFNFKGSFKCSMYLQHEGFTAMGYIDLEDPATVLKHISISF